MSQTIEAKNLGGAVMPALLLLPDKMDTPQARVMLLAIQLQEDPEQRRRQWPTGPARGLWQFERAGGVQGVLRHPQTATLARSVCAARGVPADTTAVYQTLEHDDILAAAFARLLLWSDPQPLPPIGAPAEAWQLYLRTWRPGKPHRQTWASRYDRAVAAVKAVAP